MRTDIVIKEENGRHNLYSSTAGMMFPAGDRLSRSNTLPIREFSFGDLDQAEEARKDLQAYVDKYINNTKKRK